MQAFSPYLWYNEVILLRDNLTTGVEMLVQEKILNKGVP
ncbi:hypothetical protein STRDD10_01207 [Streptococcus sp. DD10]|nr:hypothetical protein STRDD10_01207 [Streptococcus sp. DD10]